MQSVADLFVNGRHVGTHRGGAAAFTFEITDYVQFGMDNALLVVVSNSARNDVLPTSTEMNLYGGIYRDVELIVTGPTAVSPLYLGSDGVLVHPREIDSLHASGEVEVHLTSNREAPCTLTLDITAPDGSTVFTRRQRARLDGKPVVVPFAIDAPELWSRETPALYTVTAAIGEDSIVDCVRVRTGFRSLAATPGGGLQINGTRVPVHGVTLYHDNLSSGGTLTNADYEADLDHGARSGSQCAALGRDAPCAVSLRPLRRAGHPGLGRYAPAERAPSWVISPTMQRRTSRRTALCSCVRSSPRTSTTPRW